MADYKALVREILRMHPDCVRAVLSELLAGLPEKERKAWHRAVVVAMDPLDLGSALLERRIEERGRLLVALSDSLALEDQASAVRDRFRERGRPLHDDDESAG